LESAQKESFGSGIRGRDGRHEAAELRPNAPNGNSQESARCGGRATPDVQRPRASDGREPCAREDVTEESRKGAKGAKGRDVEGWMQGLAIQGRNKDFEDDVRNEP
jgi:hypothetical protein